MHTHLIHRKSSPVTTVFVFTCLTAGYIIFPPLISLHRTQKIILGPSIIPDEPVGKETVENMAVIKDPNGYTFEVTEDANRRDPVSKVSLLVLDMEKTIDFYQDVRHILEEIEDASKGALYIVTFSLPVDFPFQIVSRKMMEVPIRRRPE